eukprot:scaffold436378_cov43-Prasinocladus_malaysianus.AAC.1
MSLINFGWRVGILPQTSRQAKRFLAALIDRTAQVFVRQVVIALAEFPGLMSRWAPKGAAPLTRRSRLPRTTGRP